MYVPSIELTLGYAGNFVQTWKLSKLKISSNVNPRPHLLFHHTRTHRGGGGGHPRAISLLSVTELRDKDQRIAWGVPNLMVRRLTHLGPPLTLQDRPNKKFRFPG